MKIKLHTLDSSHCTWGRLHITGAEAWVGVGVLILIHPVLFLQRVE